MEIEQLKKAIYKCSSCNKSLNRRFNLKYTYVCVNKECNLYNICQTGQAIAKCKIDPRTQNPL